MSLAPWLPLTAPGWRKLSAAEEADLARRRDAGDLEARAELIRRNLPLAIRLAERSRRRAIDLDERIGWATIGLCKAADHFDPARGRFSTCAGLWIKQAIQYAGPAAALIHVPRNVLDALAAADAGRRLEPRVAARVAAARAALRCRAGGAFPADLPAARPAARPETDRPALLALLVEALPDLPEPEGEVIRRRHGLDGRPPETQREIGRRLGLDWGQVRTIELRALDRLRARLREVDR